jgi:ornithine carbamoyltransferase
MAQFGSFSVINALTDYEHPCQAVGDFLTILEHLKTFKGKKFAWIGDGNNVCHSLMLFAAKVGMNFTAAVPADHKPDPAVVLRAQAEARKTGAVIELVHDPAAGAANADVVYTDGTGSGTRNKDEVFQRFPGQCRTYETCKSESNFPALPTCSPRRRSDGRGHRFAAVRCVR